MRRTLFCLFCFWLKILKDIFDVLIDDKTLIDVKSVNVSKKYHMPNLASQKKLLDWLSDKDNTLKYLFIFYEKVDDIIHIKDIELKDIEEINPECLIVQAQGLGVMQIKDIKKLSFVKKIDRESWLLNVLKPKVLSYLNKEENKIKNTKKIYEKF